MPSGNPMLSRLAKLEVRVDEHDRHLGDVDSQLHEHDRDIAQLADMIVSAGNIALRATQRARARLITRRRRSRRD